MPEISVQAEWLDTAGVKSPELTETWAALRVRCGDSVITRVLDERAKTVRDVVYVPLYPLAEWLVTNWWFLMHEHANPSKESDPEFHRRHSLSFNREGYAYPNLQVIPSGSRTRLIWSRESLRWSKVEFLEQGEMLVDTGEFRESCVDLIDQVIRRLTVQGVEDTFLQDEWTTIQDADQEEIDFCATAGGLGWDPYDLDPEQRERIPRLENQFGSFLDEAIPALDPWEIDASSQALMHALDASKERVLPLARVADQGFTEQLSLSRARFPWESGYDLARRVRQQLDLGNDPLATFAALAEALDEKVELLEKATIPVRQFPDSWLVDGLVSFGESSHPAFAFRPFQDSRMRFHFCRALSDILVSPNSDSLLTRARTEKQQRNRAFAAEFLAPSYGLADRIKKRTYLDGADIDELSAEFGVATDVIIHQVQNHKLAQIWA